MKAPRLTNWSRAVSWTPQALLQPRSQDELLHALAEARRQGQTVKVVGGAHSWSDIAATDGLALSLDPLDRLLDVDVTRQRVTVEAGMRLHQLNDLLAEHGLALPTHGSIDRQSVAGVLATATHGTGRRFGSLSSLCTQLELVTAAGERLTCSAEQRPDVFEAARCHLGALGVVTQVTLQCQPAFRLHAVEEMMRWDAALERLDEEVATQEHCKLWWVPHTDTAVLFRYNRSAAPRRRNALATWVTQQVLRRSVLDALLWLGSRRPSALPRINRWVAAGTPRRLEYVDRSDKVFAFPVHVRHEECELAIPLASARETLQALRQLIEQRGFGVGFIVEVRFVQAESIWLSPAYARDTCYIGVMQYRHLPPQPYFGAAQELMRPLGARPHWGKRHDFGPSQLAALYPQWADFQRVRRQLDPQNMFDNAYLRRVLGKGQAVD
jgi:L-gulonolactone oxidase